MTHLEWKKQRKVTFDTKHGRNIKLSSSCAVATRGADVAVDGYGVIFSSEPVPIGCMFKVAVLEGDDCFNGGLGIFFTTEDPKSSELAQSWMAAALDSPGQKKLVGVFTDKVFYGGKPILPTRSKLARSTQSLTVGESVGIRLIKAEGNKVVLEVYFNNELIRTVPLPSGYPVSRPLWGVVDVYGNSTKVKADVYAPCSAVTAPSPQANGHRVRVQPMRAKAFSVDEASRMPTRPAEAMEDSELIRLRQQVKQLTDNQEVYQIQIIQLEGELQQTGQQLHITKEQLQQEQMAHQEEVRQLKDELKELALSQHERRQLNHQEPNLARGGSQSTYQQLQNSMVKRNGLRTISGQDVWLMFC